MKKFAGFTVLSAVLIPEDAHQIQIASALQRLGKRWDPSYEVRPGYLYVRSRAISSRTNDNYDEFPAEEIAKGYMTFVGKPVFVNHVNDNHRRARGVIIDAYLHRDRLSDGSPDTWCEVLMEVDAKNFPKLAKAILAGRVDRTSMGTDVDYSICSACGNKATTPAEYCNHIPRLKGKKILKKNAKTGKQEQHLIREICYGLRFFENSLLVEQPADPTAFFTGVDSSGFSKAASIRVEADEVWDDFHADDEMRKLLDRTQRTYDSGQRYRQHLTDMDKMRNRNLEPGATPVAPYPAPAGAPVCEHCQGTGCEQCEDRGWMKQGSLIQMFSSGFGKGDADDWKTCDQGHQHWGTEGAAGLLIRHRDDRGVHRYLLQQRAPWVDEGNTWGIPAGALHKGEDTLTGAMRETHEELGGVPHNLRHVKAFPDDHGGWAFTTHLVDSPSRWGSSGGPDAQHEVGPEGTKWFTAKEMEGLDLHPGFKASWDKTLRDAAEPQAKEAKGLPKTQKCKYCDEPATMRLLWAEGMAYIPTCDEHEADGRHLIVDVNHDEVCGQPRKIARAKSVYQVRVKIKDRTTGRYSGTYTGFHGAGEGWPFSLCHNHLHQLQGDIARHNEQNPNHPQTFEVEHSAWPLDSGQTSCHACATGSVNSAMAPRKNS